MLQLSFGRDFLHGLGTNHSSPNESEIPLCPKHAVIDFLDAKLYRMDCMGGDPQSQ